MLTVLRAQVQSVLYAVPAKRKPALRRSDAPDALFATDLPLVAEEASVQSFIADMNRLGWLVSMRNGWLILDCAIPAPACAMPERLTGECGCCISILQRHAGDASATDAIRAVVKAVDAGKLPFERLCGQLHSAFAASLRRHEELPGAVLPYLSYAHEIFYT